MVDAANGTVQYLEGDMGSPRVCRMRIGVPFIQISCSTSNSTSDENARNFLSVSFIHNFQMVYTKKLLVSIHFTILAQPSRLQK